MSDVNLTRLNEEQITRFNRLGPGTRRRKGTDGLGDYLQSALTQPSTGRLPSLLSLYVTGNLGHDAGPASNGALIGSLTAGAVTKCLTSAVAQAGLAIACDGGAYTDETTGSNNATANDVTLLPAAAAQNDAYYFGHATKLLKGLAITISTQGDFSGEVAWEYWNGSEWHALADVTDGTTNLSAAAATVDVTWTVPEDWEANTVNNVEAFWVRVRVTTATSGGGAKASRVYALAAEGYETWADESADLASAGAADVALFPAYARVGDAVYFGGETEKFFKLALTLSTKMTGDNTPVWEFWNGSAWAAIPAGTLEDASAGFTTGTGTYLISFMPPATWAACTAGNGPNGTAGYFIRCRMSAITSYTAAPVASSGTLRNANGTGVRINQACTVVAVQANAGTLSGSTGDSIFLLVNMTQGTFVSFTWTKASQSLDAAVSLACAADDCLALVQVAEDGSTEFANVNFVLDFDAAA